MKLRFPKPRTLLRLSAACLVLGLLGWFALPFALPLPAGLLENPGASPVLTDRHGAAIHHLTLPDSTRAAPIPLGQIPADLVACTLAAEDKRFFSHGGVDLLATARAARDLALKRRVSSGASTITQQLIKISSPRRKRGPLAKVHEILGARRLEMTWSKNQILAAYLNRLDYGNLRIGTAEATRFYFQKPLADLSLAECALLAGLPQAPTRLNPIRRTEPALKRRNIVLERLRGNSSYDESRISAALAEPLTLRPLRTVQAAPWLASLPDMRGAATRTSLDLPLQRDIEAIVREETAKLKEANLRHAAVVVIDNATGEILALVSSASWNDPRGGQFNGATQPRSPGSTLKPFTYLLAMERNHRIPSSILSDIPTPFRTAQGLDLPQNYDRKYRGPVTLRTSLACSLNLPAMRELNHLGGPRPLEDLLEKLGISTLTLPPETYGLGLTLGNAPVKLLELTNAYAAIARRGEYLPCTFFPIQGTPVPEEVFDPISAYLISDILSDPAARAPSFPPGGPLDLPFRCAVKTGTSSDFHDNWCVGYTPDFTVGVWGGNFEHQPMKGISGIAGAGPIFNRTMVRLHRDRAATWYDRPAGLIDITIDTRNGKLIPPSDFPEKPHARRDLCPPERTPVPATAADYAEGKALLDPTYREWFKSSANHRLGELALDEALPAAEPLRVITPANGTTYLLDPEIPSGSDRLRPVTNLPGVAEWSSETLVVEKGTPEPVIHLKPGTHVLTATDPRTGISHRITIRVREL
ncbi:MAG: transglycosylase domain-containing protein [Akkermansiaceae bacterium]|nr:transglycosylase domain-containing protein [Akkermansiaceae bacterium]